VDFFDEFYFENIRDYKHYVHSIEDKSTKKNLSCSMFKAVESINSDLTTVFEKIYKKCAI